MYPAVMMPDGRAMIAIPIREESILIKRPRSVTG